MKEPSKELTEKFAKRYADHQIVAQSATQHVRYWRFQKPGDWCYSFDVVATKNTVSIQGDIGNLVFDKPFGWCRGVICRDDVGISWGYVAEKVIRGIEVEEYCEQEGRNVLLEYFRDYPHEDFDEEQVEDLPRETLAEFMESMNALGNCDAWEWTSSVMVLKHDFINQVIGLRELIRKLDQERVQ